MYMRKSILILIGLLIFIGIAMNRRSIGTIESNYMLTHQNSANGTHLNESKPLIVLWNDEYGTSVKDMIELNSIGNCEYECRMVSRKSWSGERPAAFIVHARYIKPFDLPPKSTGSMMVLFIRESPVHAGDSLWQVPAAFFNASMMYHKNSDYFFPWGSFKKTRNEDEMWAASEIEDAVKLKTHGALAFISKCKTLSQREDYINKLSKHTNITIVGPCSWNTTVTVMKCGRGEPCEKDLIATHRFYLSFENSICTDYITEKFFKRVQQLLVPIVLERKLYQVAHIDQSSYLAASDFASPRQLAERIEELRSDDEEFKRYLSWTKKYSRDVFGHSNAFCRLCKDLHEGKQRALTDFQTIFSKNHCERKTLFT